MKDFNLEEFKKDPTKKVVTRDGRAVRIICTDHKRTQPIIALVSKNEKEDIQLYYPNGRWTTNQGESNLDLFFTPTKKEGWVNLYKSVVKGYLPFVSQKVYKSKDEAIKNKSDDNYLITIKIEWEE